LGCAFFSTLLQSEKTYTPIPVNSENRQFIWLTVLSFFSLSTLSATAQVTFFGVQKSAAYTQTADNTAPTTPFEYTVFAFATTTSAGDVNSFTVSDNDSISVVNSVGDPTSFGASNFYTTKAAMDSGFSSGDTYTFTANGGTYDGNTDESGCRDLNPGPRRPERRALPS
jgi:hypothetical protein